MHKNKAWYILRLDIFDFDGTLFNSPVPNPTLWGRKLAGKLMNSYEQRGFGWFRNELTLDEKYIDMDDFIASTMYDAVNSINDSNTISVLMTGRSESFRKNISKILDRNNLKFDYVILRPETDTTSSTFEYKWQYIKSLVNNNNNNNIDEINIWEDRESQLKKFDKYLPELNIPYNLIKVDGNDSHIDPELEEELVSIVMNDPRVTIPTKTHLYTALVLNDESKQILLSNFGNIIPENWKVYCHHMTLLFGNDKNTEVEKFISENEGKEFPMIITKFGISDDAIAAMVDTVVPTNNRIPHITIATPQNGKPVNSNKITNWSGVDEHISLVGRIVVHSNDLSRSNLSK